MRNSSPGRNLNNCLLQIINHRGHGGHRDFFNYARLLHFKYDSRQVLILHVNKSLSSESSKH